MQLYGYWRSSATYRVRIALSLKNISYQSIEINLIEKGGEQHSDYFHALNPTELVPVLVDGGLRINQSMVILDYLDEHYPQPLLVPITGEQRYLIRSLAQDIAVDIHPLNNLRVQQFLTHQMKVKECDKQKWLKYWIMEGFESLDEKLKPLAGKFCVGADVTLVDVCLAPQVYNALRVGVDMTKYPTLNRVYQTLMQHPAFIAAQPENQTGAPTN
ncbi:maleylacetoacetate isomerase [Vibrio renipiscarius]|uniref:Maleylacetoacetate isomerase n=1 Tax=Vibrio renipiscarius TaxID=1461322 RepID=A0A0C2NNW7_9VIBR|nr:maleylacetoacetate isomerase [Vibrio renipiscarius]KII75747.1 maleylacetoacetate isomerase [Vibrio renipiscarius]KII81803.1 maleylacetoacetate isomerase [Vibrio renipiscarius]